MLACASDDGSIRRSLTVSFICEVSWTVQKNENTKKEKGTTVRTYFVPTVFVCGVVPSSVRRARSPQIVRVGDEGA